MRIITVAVAIAALSISAFGCVSKGKHEKLKKKYDEAVAAHQAEVTTLKGEITKLEGQVAELETQKKELQAKLEETEKKRSELEGELASVIKDKAKLKESTAELKQALAQLQERQNQANARLSQLRELLAKFKALIDAGKLKVKIADGRMVLELPSDVLFESGKATLNDAGATGIAEVAQVLATLKGRKFQIEGHTDNVPISTRKFKSNWDLAAARAITVVKAMVDAGVSPTMLSGASYGEVRPAYSNDDEQGRANNRRIEIVLVPDLSQLPGFDELSKAIK